MDVVIPKTQHLLGPTSLNSAFSVNRGNDFGLLKAVFVPFLPIRGGVAVTLSQRTKTSFPLRSGFATWTQSPPQAAPLLGVMSVDEQFLSKVGMTGGGGRNEGSQRYEARCS